MAIKELTYALTDLDRVKAHADLSGHEHDTELDSLINETSVRIEGYLGRHLFSRTWTHDGTTFPRLDSNGGTTLILPEYPITDVATLKTYPTDDALTEGYADDFVVDQSAGIIELVGGRAFWSRKAIVEITYTAGYKTGLTDDTEWLYGQDEASADLRLAATKQTVWEFRQKQREREGVASRSEAGVTVSYLQRAWLPEVEEILNRHKRTYL